MLQVQATLYRGTLVEVGLMRGNRGTHAVWRPAPTGDTSCDGACACDIGLMASKSISNDKAECFRLGASSSAAVWSLLSPGRCTQCRKVGWPCWQSPYTFALETLVCKPRVL
jgi:hypothetical protein